MNDISSKELLYVAKLSGPITDAAVLSDIVAQASEQLLKIKLIGYTYGHPHFNLVVGELEDRIRDNKKMLVNTVEIYGEDSTTDCSTIVVNN